MTTGPLPIKYRPPSFDQFYGNEGLKSTLKSILTRPLDQIPHSYLLFGPPGTGKTKTLQGIIAELLHNGKRVLFSSNTNNAPLSCVAT